MNRLITKQTNSMRCLKEKKVQFQQYVLVFPASLLSLPRLFVKRVALWLQHLIAVRYGRNG